MLLTMAEKSSTSLKLIAKIPTSLINVDKGDYNMRENLSYQNKRLFYLLLTDYNCHDKNNKPKTHLVCV